MLRSSSELTPGEFIAKWRDPELKERSAQQWADHLAATSLTRALAHRPRPRRDVLRRVPAARLVAGDSRAPCPSARLDRSRAGSRPHAGEGSWRTPFPAWGLALPRFAHRGRITRVTHTRKRRLPRVRGASTIRANNWPSGQTDAGICDPDMASPPCKSSGRVHCVGPSTTPAEPTGAVASGDLSSNIPADTNGARIRQTAGNPARRPDSQRRLNNTGRRATRRRRSTDQRNTARAVPAASARTQRVRRG